MATLPYYHNIDLVLNELLNAKFQILASDPGSPAEGQFWYNSTSKKFLYRTDTETIDVIALLAVKANLASPTFTGTPSAPTAAAGTNTTQISTTAFVQAELAALVDAAPGTLNTLNELAAALGDDPNFATTITNSLAGKQPLDTDLTEIAALTPADDDVIQRKAGAWINRTMAQLKTDLSLTKSDVGLANVDNTSDATKNSAAATLTNKTIDADSNTVSNLEVDNFKATAIVTEAEGITANDNDTTLPTSAAVKDYVDNASGGAFGVYSATIGNGSATSFNITQATHGRASTSANAVTVENASTGLRVYPAVTVNPANGTVTVDFGATVPTTDQFRVHVFGVAA